MDSESYWAERAEERERLWTKKAKSTIEKELAEYYSQTFNAIEEDIAALYGRFAKDNKLSYSDAVKLLTGSEYRQWRMSMEQYLAEIKGEKDPLLTELNTLAMRKRISRLDKLRAETLKELRKLAGRTDLDVEKFLGDAYKDNYYKSLYDIGQKASISSSVAEVDSEKLKKVISSPWSGKNYSQRLWKNTDKLSRLIKQEITDGIHRGVSLQKLASLIRQRMDVGQYEAMRLVRTEMNYVQNQSALDSIADSGMKYYTFIATLDKRTSAPCRAHDRKTYLVTEAQPGKNMPPLHPNCRSTISGSFKSTGRTRGTRIGKDDAGKRITVPASMAYDDFKKIYIDKAMTMQQWEKVKQKSSKDDIILTNKILNKDIYSYKLAYMKAVAKNQSLAEREKLIQSTGKVFINRLDIKTMTGMKGQILEARQSAKNYYMKYISAKTKENFTIWQDAVQKAIDYKSGYYHFCAEAVRSNLERFRDIGMDEADLKIHLNNSRSKNLKIILEAYKLYPMSWIKRSISKGSLSIKTVKRGYYSDSERIIALSGYDKGDLFSTAIHELGHRMEHTLRSILNMEKVFYERRTKGEELQPLGKNYRPSEMTRVDRFINPYMGKDYGGYSYELVSMGFELAYTDPIALLEDEDMAAWIYGILLLL